MTRVLRQPASAHHNRFYPCLESLEDRRVLSCAITQTGGTLLIDGSRGTNFISLKDDGSGKAHNITVKCGNGATFTSGNDPVTAITVRTGRGADTIDYALTGDASSAMTLTVQGGMGRDAFTGHLNGHQLLAGANYAFNLMGGRGADDFNFTADDSVHIAAGASLTVREQGGRGRDRLAASYNGKLEGTLSFDIGGGRGFNVLDSTVNLQAGSTGTVHNSVHANGPAF
jgi:hypothetical protein